MKWLRNIACLLTLAALSAAASPINLAGSKQFAAAPPVGGGSSPAWAQNIAVGKWAQIAGASPTSPFSSTSTLSAVDPDPDHSESYNANLDGGTNTHQPSVTQSWAGATIVRNAGTFGKYAISNGGHKNYFGNEVYLFDLETLTWSRLTEPYDAISFPIVGTCGWWPAQGLQVNGSPSVEHTYDHVLSDGDNFYTIRNETDTTPTHDYCVGKLPIVGSSHVWEKKINPGTTIGSGGWSAHDTTRGVFVYRGGSGASTSPRTVQYNYTSNTATLFNPSGAANIAQLDTVAAYDPDDDMIGVVKNDGVLYGIDAGSLGTAATQLTVSGQPGSVPDQGGWEYSTTADAFFYYHDGDTVYRVKKAPGDWRTATWTWTDVTDAGNTVTPEDMIENGVYSKFQVIDYADGVSIGIVVKRVNSTGGMYAFRISSLIEPQPAANEPEYEEIALAA